MDGTLKEIGQLVGRVGSRARLFILGVLLPGFVISCEIGVFLAAGDSNRPRQLVTWAEETFQSPVVSGILAILLVLAVSYVLGYLSREFTFTLSTAWLRRRWRPTRRVSRILKQLRIVYGARQVDNVIARHKVFRLVRHENDFAEQDLPRPPDFYIREYCKLWLRTMVPALSTEYMEVEINLAIGLVIPIFLAVIPCMVFLPNLFGPVVTVITAVAIGLIAFRMLYSINGVRCQETEEAVLNFLFAHWTGLADQLQQKKRSEAAGSPQIADKDSDEDDKGEGETVPEESERQE